METPQLSDGRKIIARICADLPGTPGVYRMIDASGTILYIGKAKHLKNRVSNYLNVGALNTRLQRMITNTASMEIITTRSEAEALLLEANLIKKFSPRYNILLKDDKSFPYIFFSGDHEFARIGKHRGAKTPKGKYFGPFVSGLAVNETLTFLQKAFLLRSCSDSVFKNRTRPCMLYQIKRCCAPCVGKIEKKEYDALSNQAQDFLSGKSRTIHDELVKEMQAFSEAMDYESARIIRDRIKAFTQVQQQNGLRAAAVGDADIIALARQGKDCCIQLFSFRGGRNYGNRAWFPVHSEEYSESEILRNFIGQHYQTQPPPGLILTSHAIGESALLEEALRLHHDYKIEIVHPQRGEKRELAEQAARNAREALMRHLTQQASNRVSLEAVQILFGIEEIKRIEVYDNSHISGTHAVGAMIVAGPDGFIKSEYRTFNIKNEELTPGDDYGMLREVLSRRFIRLQEANDPSKIPDLVLIDGGAGQLSAARKIFVELGVQVCYAAISKGPDRNAGREWFHMPGREPFQLPEGDSVLHYLQRLRDEAHRFAIGAHRNKRSRAIPKSELDAIAGIGPGRKKALLHHFGSAREVASASIEDIQKTPGISKATARIIFDYFHPA